MGVTGAMVVTTAERTFALVVGIERYAMKECRDLDGPAHDACRFVDWLRRHEVPAANIRLFLSPLEANSTVRPSDPAFAGARLADSELIRETLLNDLMPKAGDLLLVFWGGHGVSDDQDRRFLFYADATSGDRRNLNLDSLLRRFRTRDCGIARQVFFVDACATLAEDLAIPKDDYGDSGAAEPTRQSVFYAAGIKQVAKNLNEEKTGLYAKHFLTALDAEPDFPPDLERVQAAIDAVFDTLVAEGKARQVPQRVEVVIGGNRKQRRDGIAPEEDAVGRMVPKLYNRTFQDGDFSAALRGGLAAHPSLQTFVVFGEEYEAHRSLVQRLIAMRIRPQAEDLWGDGDGTVREVELLDWPNAPPRAAALTKKVSRLLYLESESRADSFERAYDILAASPGFTDYKLIVVSQQVVVAEWTPSQRDLLRWYVREFWARRPPQPDEPSVVLFLLVVCPEALATTRGTTAATVKEEIWAELERIGSEASASTSALLLDELTEVTETDLRNWFVKYIDGLARGSANAADEAKSLRGRAKTRRDGIRRTDHLEQLLTEVHSYWIERSGVGT
ncbi:MAG: caspase family protein [Gemmatimonadota bacterium]